MTLDCGHEPTPTEGAGNGIAFDSDMSTMCYECAAGKLKADALMNNHIVAYVSSDGHRVTTWDGQELGKVLDYHDAGQYRTFYRAKLWDGRAWYGWGPSESGTYVSLRPYKSQ